MARRRADRKEPVIRGTGNVFADLGYPDAAERQAKLRLAYELNQALDRDIEIVIRAKPRSRKAGRISVVAA
jgi:hypothetical protein